MDKDILRVLGALGLEKKANEVMHTTNTGKGAELVPDKILMDQVFEAVPTYGSFLGALPGYHGSGLQKSQDVPIIGMVDEFIGNPEWTTGALTPPTPDGQYLPTDEITLNQKGFIKYIPISRDLLNYSATDLEALIMRKLSEAAALTVESCILNGDPDANDNVNDDAGAPAATTYFRTIGVDGLRATAITAGDTVNVGTMDFSDLTSIQGLIGDYASNPADCMWLFNRQTHQKALSISEFANASINGKSSTVFEGSISNVLGSDVAIPKRLLLAQASGKVHTTTGNTTGQIVYFWKPAVQYGFGSILDIQAVRVPGKGIMLIAAFDMALGIVSKKAGVTTPAVAMGRNVTV